MTKKEIIWRSILHDTLENKKIEFTQKELASQFGFSLSTVFNALKALRQSGAIKVTGRHFIVRDAEKFMYFWATGRNLEKDIIYETRVNVAINEIKKRFPFSEGYANLIILKSDPYLASLGSVTPNVQTFADLWNVKEWYAKPFLDSLKNKMF